MSKIKKVWEEIKAFMKYNSEQYEKGGYRSYTEDYTYGRDPYLTKEDRLNKYLNNKSG